MTTNSIRRELDATQAQADKEFREISEIVYNCYVDGNLEATFENKADAKAFKMSNETAWVLKIVRSKNDPEHVFYVETVYDTYEKVEIPFNQKLGIEIEKSKHSMRQLSMLLDIPYRTMQDWKAGRRTPPDYIQENVLNKIEALG